MVMLQSDGTPPPGADLIKDVTTQSFTKDVIEESRTQPVLVDFWAPWCEPCKQLTPALEKVVRSGKGKIKLAKMNIDEHPGIPGQMGIQSIPAVIAFVKGQPIDGFMGALPEGQIKGFVERVIKGKLGDEADELLEAADAALADGDAAEAAELYGQVVAKDSTNIPALVGLARAYLKFGAVGQAKQTLELVPQTKRHDATVAAARAEIELAEQAALLGPTTELEQKLAANPADHQARYDLAVALNAQGDRNAALDHLLEIVKRDRKWNEDGARKQLVQLFDAWGPTDESTVAGRRRLSSLLFS
jgi:putative thioredoxin